jgi:hypothetical protein
MTTSPISTPHLNLESLPAEILEAIVTPVHRETRGVSRTLRAATEREFQQLCRRPIFDHELRTYLDLGPQQIALLPRLAEVERVIVETFQQRRDTTVRFNLYHCVNNQLGTKGEDNDIICFYRPYFVALDLHPRQLTVGTTDSWGHVSESPDINDAFDTANDIVGQSHTHELDLVTQWRILTQRLGCRATTSTTSNDTAAAREFAREYLHHQLTDRFNLIITRVNELLGHRQPATHFLALGLWRYWELYIFVNATLFGVWPINRSSFIDIETDIKYVTRDRIDEWRDFDDDEVYQAIHRMLDLVP